MNKLSQVRNFKFFLTLLWQKKKKHKQKNPKNKTVGNK